mmetsp:Transcript_52623/g.125706  ORF Transcript_52623/g.125706 Transcript_52623/m.125706 type:complete len:496 (+) Transcript_52623:138-1625(+)
MSMLLLTSSTSPRHFSVASALSRDSSINSIKTDKFEARASRRSRQNLRRSLVLFEDTAWDAAPPGLLRSATSRGSVAKQGSREEHSAEDANHAPNPPADMQHDKGLPPRPYHELPKGHCMLSGLRFSSLPAKYRPEMSFPPRRSLRPSPPRAEEGEPAATTSSGSKLTRVQSESALHRKAGAGLRQTDCHGDYCSTEVRGPASLQEIENNEHPWFVEAKSLCQRHLPSHPKQPLLLPEEMAVGAEAIKAEIAAAASASAASQKAGRGATAKKPVRMRINYSWILEARAHPELCSWLEHDLGWMISQENTALISKAGAKMTKDESEELAPNGLGQVGLAGMRYKLQEVPVCSTCWCAYNVVRSTLLLCRRKAKGAAKAHAGALGHAVSSQALNQEASTRERDSAQFSAPTLGPDTEPLRLTGHLPRSLFLDPQVEAWLHNPLFEAQAAGLATRASMRRGAIQRRCSASRRKSFLQAGDIADAGPGLRRRSTMSVTS